jgi:thiamine biosynthesis lipoprotein
MSTYISDSEISRFNQAEANQIVSISEPFRNVVSAALRVSELSNGLFDITTQPLIDAWGFDSSTIAIKTLGDEQLRDLQQKTGYRKLDLDDTGLVKKQAGVQINLSAIAKGYAVDQLSSILVEQGYLNHLVDIGGELKGMGLNKRRSKWKLGIETPDTSEFGSVEAMIEVSGEAVATSGDYRNYIEIFGQKFSHVMDPIKGKPVSHRLASVTVVDDSAMLADAWATTLMVMGEESGFEFAQNNKMKAFFLVRNPINSTKNGVKSDQDQFQILFTDQFQQYLLNTQ